MMNDEDVHDTHFEFDGALPLESIQRRIHVMRGRNVLLDQDLAVLYGVETKALVRAMKRNINRFPIDFMFQLNEAEFANLRFQSGTSSGWGGRRTFPYAFTEQGVAMLASVLRSDQAVAVNIAIVRAFVQMRMVLGSHQELAHRLDELERRMTEHDIKHDTQIGQIIEAIRQLMEPETVTRRSVGFTVPDAEATS